jgi:hypothetical protein
MKVVVSWLISAGLFLSACGEEVENKGSSTAPPQVAAAPAAKAVSDRTGDVQGGALVYTLTGEGLEPGLRFGMPRAEVLAVAARRFGEPRLERNDECGEGPMDFATIRGLTLSFQEGRFVGWSLAEKLPDLGTRGGVGIRSPKSMLRGARIDRESTLGPEFDLDGVGGLLDSKEREVIALWAGSTCQFR